MRPLCLLFSRTRTRTSCFDDTRTALSEKKDKKQTKNRKPNFMCYFFLKASVESVLENSHLPESTLFVLWMHNWGFDFVPLHFLLTKLTLAIMISLLHPIMSFFGRVWGPRGLGGAFAPAVRVGGVVLAAAGSASLMSPSAAGLLAAETSVLCCCCCFFFSESPSDLNPECDRSRTTVRQAMASVGTATVDIVNWDHVRKLVHYENWPNVPRWVKIALYIGGSAVLLARVWRWFWSRKKFTSLRRLVSFYGTFLPMVFDYKLTDYRVRNRFALFEIMNLPHAGKHQPFC
jgi:glutaredoxin-related protein